MNKEIAYPLPEEAPETDWTARAIHYGGWAEDPGLLENVVALGQVKDHHTVLELGGGGGVLATAIAERGSDVHVDVLDLSMGMLKAAKKYNGRTNQMVFFQANGQEAPLPKDRYDRTFLRMVLHHATRPDVMVAEAARVTRKEGLIVLTEGTPPSRTDEVLNHFNRVFAKKEKRHTIWEDDLAKWIEMAGVRVVAQEEYFIRGVSLADWLRRSDLDHEGKRKIWNMEFEQKPEVRKAYNTVYLYRGMQYRTLPQRLGPQDIDDIIVDWRYVTVVGEK